MSPRPIVLGFDGQQADLQWLRGVRPAGVILFKRNLATLQQTRDLCAQLHSLDPKPFIAVDLEGGRVNRLRHLLGDLPPLGRVKHRVDARHHGRTIGHGLRALGFDVNFAPVVDLDFGKPDNGLADRTLSHAVEPTAQLACGFIDGLRDAGIEACVKHFPGLGSTSPDSHLRLPRMESERAEWVMGEAAVYRRLAGLGYGDVPIMLAHVQVPFWGNQIASVGGRSVEYLSELKWGGLRLTDDMEMGALDQAAMGSLSHEALSNGLDAVMICHSRDKIEVVRERLDRVSKWDMSRLRQLSRRLEQMQRGRAVSLPAAQAQWAALSRRSMA